MTDNEKNQEQQPEEEVITEELKKLMKQKLDPIIQDIATQTTATVPLIVQTVDGLKDEDKELVEKLEGNVKDNLYIINAFSVDISANAVLKLIKSPRVVKVFYDSEVRAL